MRKKFLLALCILSCISASAQMFSNMDRFTNYKDFSIPKPEGKSVSLSKSDLKLTDKYLDLYPDGTPTLSREGLQKMYDFFKNDPGGQKAWSKDVSMTARIIGSWDIKSKSGFGANRYIYSLSQLQTLATVYMFTGCEPISLFIRGHLAKMVSLPLDFWVHAELRGLDPKHPKGALETAQLNCMLGFAIAATKKDMSADELKAIENAWFERGHKTAYNWLDKFKPNNWTAVIATGLLYSSHYFNDPVGKKRALKALRFYADTTVGPDGSYGEGNGYFTYPAGELVKSAFVMSPEEIEETYGKSNLRHSMEWKIYGMLLDADESGKPGALRISYGDNHHGDSGIANEYFTVFADIAYQDGIAAWARERWNGQLSETDIILSDKFKGHDATTATSPKDAKLPLLKVFDSGDCYFHSSWDDNAVVLGLKAGDHGGRVGHAHTRPELNSITLGAYGEFFIPACGSASYRSKIYNEHDLCAPAFNTINIDGMNQKSTRTPAIKEGRWDNSAVWVHDDQPLAKVTKSECSADGAMFLKSEYTNVFHVDMNEAYRTVQYIPEGGFFIVRDRIVPKDGASHTYDYRYNIYNRDEKTIISGKANSLKIQRPRADLYIALASNAKMDLKKKDGYLHAPNGRDYDEGGPLTGKPGSAIELDWSANGKTLEVTAVLFPKKAGSRAPKIKISGDKVTVDGKTYTAR